jgi:hypothetical protein
MHREAESRYLTSQYPAYQVALASDPLSL